MGDLWVFGYGSLMWRPGFPFLERQVGTIRGYHRRLCVYSHHHRGTPERPGLVLGLDRGGACRGLLFRVAAADRDATIAYLREREQVTAVYREIEARVAVAPDRVVTALAYVVDRQHSQYAGVLPREALLAHVRQGVGVSGANPDYVLNTVAHLEELGLHDATLAWVGARLIEDRVPDADA